MNITKKELQRELLKLKLKQKQTSGDKLKIQKLQQQLDRKYG